MKQILEIIIGGDASRFGAAANTAIAHLDRINRVGGRIATGAFVAFGYFAKRMVDVASNIVDMSAQLSVSASRLRAMETAGATLGVTLEGLGKAMREFQRSQAAAMRGPGLDRSAFEQLGISITELKTLRPDEGVLRLSDALQKAGKNASTLDAALAILGGRTGLKLAGAMRSGWAEAVRDFEKSGLIPTDADLQKVDDVGDRWVAVVKRIQNEFFKSAPGILSFVNMVFAGISKVGQHVKNTAEAGLRLGLSGIAKAALMMMPSGGGAFAARFLKWEKPAGLWEINNIVDDWEAERKRIEAAVDEWFKDKTTSAGEDTGGVPDPLVDVEKTRRSTAIPSADALARIGLFRGGSGDPAQRTRNQQLAELRRLNSQVAQLNSELTNAD